ncbi:hypothetical protein E1H18_3482 [Caulobacter sp. RHG1]|nr:hypothetical protein [Caulobacter sp. RHG1]
MGVMAMTITWLLLAVGAAAPPHAKRQIIPTPQVAVRACVDLLGLKAECGARFPDQSFCYAADAFGRCDGDPSCFDPDGTQVRCALPVRQIDPCPGRPIIALNDKGLVIRIASHITQMRLCPAEKTLPF